MSFFAELKRRNVLRVAAAYIVTAWLVIQVVETIFPAFGFGDVAVRYVTIAFAVGLLPALVVAWVFELTPEGLKKDADVDHDRKFVADSAKRLDRIILLVLALALGYFAFDKFVLAPQREAVEAKQQEEELERARAEGRSEALVESYGDASIAVLAFENISADPEQEFFATGVSEEILNLLAGIPELRVISRSSAFTYKGKNVPVKQIARELDVAHVLEGSVRKAGNQVRITAQLNDGRTDTQLWSQTWERSMDDIFAIQDEVAADVVAELQLKLADTMPTSRRTDSEAYALTLQAKEFIRNPHRADFVEVARMLDRAIELDPDYVPALEQRLWVVYLLTGNVLSPEQSDEQWKYWRGRILAVDPDNAYVGGSDAWELFANDRDFEAAAAEYSALIARAPNDAELLRTASGFLRRIGKFDESATLATHCKKIDPLNHPCTWSIKEAYLWGGELEQARVYLDRLQTVWGQPPRVHDILLLLLEGRPEDARARVEAWDNTGSLKPALLALAAHDLGDQDEYARLMHVFLENPETYRLAPHRRLLDTASLSAYVGDLDEAFHNLEQLRDLDEAMLVENLLSPWFWNLHGDPRWTKLREEVAMSKERLENIEFKIPKNWSPPADD